MKYIVFSLLLIFLFGVCAFFYSFSLMSGHHVYGEKDFLSYWLYTPDALKDMPEISSEVSFEYDYDLDHSQALFVARWDRVENIVAEKEMLIKYIKRFNSSINNDCVWTFYNTEDYSDNYKRYCVRQKNNSLELEYFETMN